MTAFRVARDTQDYREFVLMENAGLMKTRYI